MNDRNSVLAKSTMLVIAVFLILTAWGNAVAMFAISTIALIAMLVMRGNSWRTWSAALVGAALAAFIVFSLVS